MKLPEYYEFYSQPKFVSGKRALEQLSTELQEYGAGRPLVLCDPGAGIDKTITKAFYESNIVIGALVPDPPPASGIDTIRSLTLLFRERGCDSIIVAGSGSTVDIAKGVNIALGVSGELKKYTGTNFLKNRLMPLFLVPTMKSEGREAGNEITIDGVLYKSDFLYPDSVIIDPRILKNKSVEDVVHSSMIALTHAIESCADEVSNPLADAYALSAIQYISENIVNIVKSPSDTKGKIALANAYAMSGIVFANGVPGPAHYLSLACAESAQISSGICMGIILPWTLDYKIKMKKNVREELLLALGGMGLHSLTPLKERPLKAVSYLFGLLENLRTYIPVNLKAVGFLEADIQAAAKRAVEMSRKTLKLNDCQTILLRAWEGPAK